MNKSDAIACMKAIKNVDVVCATEDHADVHLTRMSAVAAVANGKPVCGFYDGNKAYTRDDVLREVVRPKIKDFSETTADKTLRAAVQADRFVYCDRFATGSWTGGMVYPGPIFEKAKCRHLFIVISGGNGVNVQMVTHFPCPYDYFNKHARVT